MNSGDQVSGAPWHIVRRDVEPGPAADYRRMWREMTGWPLDPETASLMVRSGWTGEAITSLQALAQHALAHDTGLVGRTRNTHRGHLSGEALRHATEMTLLTAGETLLGLADLPVGDVLGWLSTVAYSGDVRETEKVEALLPYAPPFVVWADTKLFRWQQAGPIEVATLAYMAGWTAEDAATERRADRLNVTALRVLAGLRGYRLPASSEG